jgi:hypothetical protein
MKNSHGQDTYKGKKAWIANDNQDTSVENFLIGS